MASSKNGPLRSALVVVATLYLVTVWLDGVGSNLPAKITPRVWLYFGQIAALFKSAGMMAIDYRAEGWSCAEHRWVEVDVRPWFRIDAENKESRFHRALQFYRRERKVMRALEDYVVQRNNDGGAKIGGVRFLSLRIPYPKIGEPVTALARKPLAEYPVEVRHEWYWTPTSRRYERCGERPPPQARDIGASGPVDPRAPKSDPRSDDDDHAPSSSDGKAPEP